MKAIIIILSLITFISCRSNYAYDGSVLGKERGVKCTAKFISNDYLKAQDSSFDGNYNLARVRFFYLKKSRNQIHKYCFYVKDMKDNILFDSSTHYIDSLGGKPFIMDVKVPKELNRFMLYVEDGETGQRSSFYLMVSLHYKLFLLCLLFLLLHLHSI